MHWRSLGLPSEESAYHSENVSMKRRNARTDSIKCPPEVFDRLTDILADLVLEDLTQFPKLGTFRPIDTSLRADNTAVTAYQGEG